MGDYVHRTKAQTRAKIQYADARERRSRLLRNPPRAALRLSHGPGMVPRLWRHGRRGCQEGVQGHAQAQGGERKEPPNAKGRRIGKEEEEKEEEGQEGIRRGGI